MADELEESGDGFSDNGRSQVTDVHLLGDVRRGEVDDDAFQTGCDRRTNALKRGRRKKMFETSVDSQLYARKMNSVSYSLVVQKYVSECYHETGYQAASIPQPKFHHERGPLPLIFLLSIGQSTFRHYLDQKLGDFVGDVLLLEPDVDKARAGNLEAGNDFVIRGDFGQNGGGDVAR